MSRFLRNFLPLRKRSKAASSDLSPPFLIKVSISSPISELFTLKRQYASTIAATNITNTMIMSTSRRKSNPFNSVFFRSIKKASGYLPRSPKIYMMFTFFCGMPQTPTPAYRRLPRMWRVREPANLRQTKAYCPKNPCLQVTIPARYCLSL